MKSFVYIIQIQDPKPMIFLKKIIDKLVLFLDLSTWRSGFYTLAMWLKRKKSSDKKKDEEYRKTVYSHTVTMILRENF